MNTTQRPLRLARPPDKAPATCRPLRGTHRIALNNVSSVNGRVIRDGGEPFDARTYSRFKHGGGEEANDYAFRLSAHLLAHHLQPVLAHDEPMIVCGSAFKHVPTAAYHVATSVATGLRHAGIATTFGYISRGKLAEGDYSTMPLAQREALMGDNALSFEKPLFEGKHVLIVDDIRITGSHERAVMELMDGLPILSLTMAYVLEMDARAALVDPSIESKINQAAIKDLHDLFKLIRDQGSFSVTARVVKFVLDSEATEVKWFLQRLIYEDIDSVRMLYLGSIGDGYDRMARYGDTFALIAKADQIRHHHTFSTGNRFGISGNAETVRQIEAAFSAGNTNYAYQTQPLRSLAWARYKPSAVLARMGL